MSKQFFSLSASDRREILSTAATQLGRSAVVLEKDVWVCWALQCLFSLPNAHPMAFKGGTSLSKVYQAIHRFSEDIDVTLDYRCFNDEVDPTRSSKTQVKKLSERLKGYVKTYANNTVLPFIKAQVRSLPTKTQCDVTIDDAGENITLNFESVVESEDESDEDYLKSGVIIELGGRNVIVPNEQHTIYPDIMSQTKGVEYPSPTVTVLSPQRTFWEKISLMHVECQRNRLTDSMERLSRHWYDIFMLSQHSIGHNALANRALLKDVIEHKKLFFNASYAQYDSCLTGQLTLVPDDSILYALENDYDKMLSAGMIYGDPVDFHGMMERIKEIENRINQQGDSS